MNILEAIKSGSRFRRPTWDIYYSESHEGFLELTPEDLVAEDWELERKEVTITEGQFDEAWQRAETNNVAGQWLKGFKAHVKKELGL